MTTIQNMPGNQKRQTLICLRTCIKHLPSNSKSLDHSGVSPRRQATEPPQNLQNLKLFSTFPPHSGQNLASFELLGALRGASAALTPATLAGFCALKLAFVSGWPFAAIPRNLFEFCSSSCLRGCCRLPVAELREPVLASAPIPIIVFHWSSICFSNCFCCSGVRNCDAFAILIIIICLCCICICIHASCCAR